MKNIEPESPLNLSELVRRERKKLGLTQKELADLAKINFTTVNRIERAITSTKGMRTSVIEGLSKALHIPPDVLKKMGKGKVISFDVKKICPKCWIPGSAPDSRWNGVDSVYCMRCATALTSDCSCGEPIVIHGRFCPQCGKSYKTR